MSECLGKCYSLMLIYLEDCYFKCLSLCFWNRKQEERVQQVRKKLEEALMADILSRAADTTKDMDVEMDNGNEA